MSQKSNPAAVAADLAKYREANMRPSARAQIASPEVWSEVTAMQAAGFSLDEIAAALIAAGIDGKANSAKTHIKAISKERAGVPATTDQPPEAVVINRNPRTEKPTEEAA